MPMFQDWKKTVEWLESKGFEVSAWRPSGTRVFQVNHKQAFNGSNSIRGVYLRNARELDVFATGIENGELLQRFIDSQTNQTR